MIKYKKLLKQKIQMKYVYMHKHFGKEQMVYQKKIKLLNKQKEDKN